MRKYFNIYTIIILVGFCLELSGIQIHVFGDSHASFCFSNERTKIPRDEHSYFYYNDHGIITPIEFIIHWFESKTMHRIGRDGLAILNLNQYGVREGDVAVFLFGEIDVRCHIGKQRDEKGRQLDEVIDTLATNFLQVIQNNRKRYASLYCVVVSITPPTNNCFNWVYPYYGPIEDRANITRRLNAKLKELCDVYGFGFLDIYSLYATPEGFLDDAVSDHVVHVNPIHNDQIKNRLVELLKRVHIF